MRIPAVLPNECEQDQDQVTYFDEHPMISGLIGERGTKPRVAAAVVADGKLLEPGRLPLIELPFDWQSQGGVSQMIACRVLKKAEWQ